MDTKLSAQIQMVMDTVARAEAEMASLATTMRRHSVYFGPECNHVEEELRNIIDKLTFMKYVAKHREAEPATHQIQRKSFQD